MTGFDVIGNIAVIKPQESEKKDKELAEKLLKQNNNIKTVAVKASRVKGRLRLLKLKIIAGEKTEETIHKENNCKLKLNIEKCYFSPRLGADRLEIAQKIKRGEKILVLFAGVAPYAIVIAKNSKAKEIHAIELNRIACKYAEENVKLNKLNNVKIIQGDVKKILPKLAKQKLKFDRILMPRPQLKDTFLKEAFLVAKKSTIIHYHDFLLENEIPDIAIKKIQTEAKKSKKKIKILAWKKVGELAPYKFRVRFDFKII
ncbi:methyltransferase domain-containing protein [Candidatus Pacearchaeota archaeon]|nr:methyltransferase domain-containing protein [Candidatus Pacearchaeota archaeon]